MNLHKVPNKGFVHSTMKIALIYSPFSLFKPLWLSQTQSVQQNVSIFIWWKQTVLKGRQAQKHIKSVSYGRETTWGRLNDDSSQFCLNCSCKLRWKNQQLSTCDVCCNYSHILKLSDLLSAARSSVTACCFSYLGGFWCSYLTDCVFGSLRCSEDFKSTVLIYSLEIPIWSRMCYQRREGRRHSDIPVCPR